MYPSLKNLFEKQRGQKELGKKFHTPEEQWRILQDMQNKYEPYLFAHYSHIPKLGLNPQTYKKYNTPVGIYSYPIGGYGTNTSGYRAEQIIKGKVPFGENREHIVVFTVEPSYKQGVIILDRNGNATSDSPIKEDYINKLIVKRGGTQKLDMDSFFRESLGDIEDKEGINNIENILKEAATVLINAESIGKNIVMTAFINVIDGKKKLTPYLLDNIINEMHRKLYFGRSYKGSSVKLEDGTREYQLVNDVIDFLKIIKDDYNEKDEKQTYVKGQMGARVQSLFGQYWNITRLEVNENPIRWGQTLMKDGIAGVIDMVSGIVHPSEKTQPVFFSKEPLKLLGIFDNQHVKAKEKSSKGGNLTIEEVRNFGQFVNIMKNNIGHSKELALEYCTQLYFFLLNQAYNNKSNIVDFKLVQQQLYYNLWRSGVKQINDYILFSKYALIPKFIFFKKIVNLMGL